MYVGRIVSVGLTGDNRLCVMYRVSSRSFPNRVISEIDGALSVLPAEGFESDIYRSPYISYNCLRNNQRYAVVGNGTHTDPVYEKLQAGMSMRDSLTAVLFGMDYEHDALDTPRISAVVDRQERRAALGIIRKNGIEVQEFELQRGCYRYVATYEHCQLLSSFSGSELVLSSAEEATKYILGSGAFELFEKPVSAAAAMECDSGFAIASHNLPVQS